MQTSARESYKGGAITMPTFRQRLEWILRLSLILFTLASVAFLSALIAVRFAIQGREVAMPDVLGVKSVAAQQLLQGRGVGMKVEDRIYNPAPADTIVRQSPSAGTRVKVGQYAHVVISLGPQSATIPLLEQRSIRAARIELLRDRLQVGEISSVYLAGFPEETVVQQVPAPGTTEVTSPHVDLLVALGTRPAAYVMPDLTGMPLNDAGSKLRSSGLRILKFTQTPAPGISHGIVVGQNPPRGSRVDAESSIEVQVAQ
jgi:eukaryotic-like serine/threonine-protein kinase